MRRPTTEAIAEGIAQYCKMSKLDLMAMMDFHIYDETGGYLGFKSTPGAKVLAVAHVDYVGTGTVHEITKTKVVSSALDDRAGVYTALELLPAWGIQADVLLTDNEECGQSSIKSLGAGMLAKYNWIVELDRRGTDAVVYRFKGMEDFLSGYFPAGRGSYSDICELEDVSPVMGFNMGVGYHNEHTEKCYIDVQELRQQLNRLLRFYTEYRDVTMYQVYYAEEIRGEANEYYDYGQPAEPEDWEWAEGGHCDSGEDLFYWERRV